MAAGSRFGSLTSARQADERCRVLSFVARPLEKSCMNAEIAPRATLIRLLLLIAALSAANIGILIATLSSGREVNELERTFLFNAERNVPTAYSALALLTCAILIAFIGLLHKRAGEPALLWYFLAFVFLFLAVDEYESIHEKLGEYVGDALDPSGVFYFAWVIPYGIAVAAFVALYFRFLLRLPRRTMVLFVVSGLIFVTGAIGFEMLGGLIADEPGHNGVWYGAVSTIEETMEMLGIALFIYALLDYIVATSCESFTIRFVPDNRSRIS